MCNSMWLVQTVVGHEGVAGWSDGISQQARLNKPTSISCLADASFIIADAGNNCLRLVHPNVRRGSKMRPQEEHLSRWKDGSGFDTRALGLVDFMVSVCCIRAGGAAAQPRRGREQPCALRAPCLSSHAFASASASAAAAAG
jgi:hypothetical protein